MKYELIQKNKKYLDLILDAVKKQLVIFILQLTPIVKAKLLLGMLLPYFLKKNLLRIKKYPESFFLKSQKKLSYLQ